MSSIKAAAPMRGEQREAGSGDDLLARARLTPPHWNAQPWTALPRCAECNHLQSVHWRRGLAKGQCKVKRCSCSEWREPLGVDPR
jgi:hypothetical protein